VRSSTEVAGTGVELGVTGVMVGVHVRKVVGTPIVGVMDGVTVIVGVSVGVPGLGVRVGVGEISGVTVG